LNGAHVVRALVVDFADVFDEGFEDLFGEDVVVAVLEIDVVGFEFVAGADAGPEVFVGGEGGGEL
jgi:hypothetical protein